jgi:hypothetical protein
MTGILAPTVVVSRLWHKPEIAIEVSGEGIALGMQFDDVIDALVEELGNPVTILTREQLRVRIKAAAGRVVEGIKAASAQAPPIPARETIA